MKTLIIFTILALLGGNPVKFLQNRQQEKTIETLTDLDEGHLYMMDYKADYRLQDFIDGDYDSQAAAKVAVSKILMNVPQAKPQAGVVNPACSAFQAQTPDGDIIYGRNFDYHFKDGASIIMRSSPKKGYKSLSTVSMNFVGLEGAQLIDGKTDLSMLVGAPYMSMDGMNEKGFAISVLALTGDDCAKQYEPGKHSVMTSVMMRMLLDRAANVDEALAMLKDYNFFADGVQKDRKPGSKTNYHFLLSDASGKTVVLEYVKEDGKDSSSKWVMSVLGNKFVTNFFLTPGWSEPKNVDKRYKRLEEVLTSKGNVLSEEDAMHLLDDVHQTAGENNSSRTQWSVVYNLTKKTATVCVNHDYSKSFTYSLKHFKRLGK